MRTCRQVLSEIRGLLCGTPEFVFELAVRPISSSSIPNVWDMDNKMLDLYKWSHWLVAIGRENLLKLKKMSIQVVRTKNGAINNPCWPFSWISVLHTPLAMTFRLLAAGHGLNRLSLSFRSPFLVKNFFEGGLNSGLVAELARIRGVGVFELSPKPDTPRDQELLRILTEKIQSSPASPASPGSWTSIQQHEGEGDKCNNTKKQTAG